MNAQQREQLRTEIYAHVATLSAEERKRAVRRVALDIAVGVPITAGWVALVLAYLRVW